jgi:hypothetical protein
MPVFFVCAEHELDKGVAAEYNERQQKFYGKFSFILIPPEGG